MRYWSSDFHFGHANIIRFSERPFREVASMDEALSDDRRVSVSHMNEAIVASINEHVGHDDELWVLGDIAMGQLDETLKIMRRLVCRNITLIAGNHDRCHPYNGQKAEKWIARYTEDTGVSTLILGETTTLIGDILVKVNHFPYAGNSHEMTRGADGRQFVDKFADWRPTDDGGWLMCGHVHDAWRVQGRQVNVGIDAWGGVPVSEDTIAEVIANGPVNLKRLTWV